MNLNGHYGIPPLFAFLIQIMSAMNVYYRKATISEYAYTVGFYATFTLSWKYLFMFVASRWCHALTPKYYENNEQAPYSKYEKFIGTVGIIITIVYSIVLPIHQFNVEMAKV